MFNTFISIVGIISNEKKVLKNYVSNVHKVLENNFSNYEVILINNQAHNTTLNIIKSFKEKVKKNWALDVK